MGNFYFSDIGDENLVILFPNWNEHLKVHQQVNVTHNSPYREPL